MLGNQDRAKDRARHLFDAVIARGDQMPEGSRPAVLLHGESLGSFGSESLFERTEDIQEPVQGRVVGRPPPANRLWQQLAAQRHPRSPFW